MANVAYLPIEVDRYGAAVRQIYIRGLDLTGIAMRAQVRLGGDVPGAPLADLLTVTNPNAEGFRLVEVTNDAGVPVSHVQLIINETTIKAMPYSGELGSETALAWDWQITLAGRKQRIAKGEFVITGDGVTGADGAPAARPAGWSNSFSPSAGIRTGATLTFGPEEISVAIDGADLLGPLASKAQQALDKINDFTRGDTGPANSTFKTKSALTAAPATNGSYIFAPQGGSDEGLQAGTFLFQTADAPYVDDGANVIALGSVAPAIGALVRQTASSISARQGPGGPLILMANAFEYGARLSRYDDTASDKTSAFRKAIEEATEKKIGKLIVPVESYTGTARWDIYDSIATPDMPLPDGLKIVGEGALNPEHPYITTGTGTYIVYHGPDAIFDMNFAGAGQGARRGGWEFNGLRLGWTDLNAAGAFRINRQDPAYLPSDTDDYAYVQNAIFTGHNWFGYMGSAAGVVKGAGFSGAKLLGWTFSEGTQPSRARYSIDLLGCDDMRIKCMRSGPIRHRRANTFGNNLMVEVPWMGFGDPEYTDPADQVYALYLSGNSSYVNVRHIELSGYTPALKAIVYVDGDSDTLELGALTGVQGGNAVPIARIGPNCRDTVGRGWTAIVPDDRQAAIEDAPVSRSYGDIRNNFRLTLTDANENMRALAIKSATRVVLDHVPSIPAFGIPRGYSPDVRRITTGTGRYPAEVIATPRGFDFPYGGNATNAPLKVIETPVPDGVAFKMVAGQGHLILGTVQAGVHFAPGAQLTVRARVKAANAGSNLSFYYLKNGGFVAAISDCKTAGAYREDKVVVDTTSWSAGDTLSYFIAEGSGNAQDLYVEYHGVTQ